MSISHFALVCSSQPEIHSGLGALLTVAQKRAGSSYCEI